MRSVEVPERRSFDVCVVGAGLIGLATARALIEAFDGISVVVVDKEDRLAAHQSSHNSGVVHSGLYYDPGSLKAKLSVEGRTVIYEMCEREAIPYRRSGKLVVATHPRELPALDELERRGRANGLTGLSRIDRHQIAELEPEATGIEALHVPEAGVVDFPELANWIGRDIQRKGASVVTNAGVSAIDQNDAGLRISTTGGEFYAKALVNCAGLQSDLVSRMAGIDPSIRIVPFRGEYYRLETAASNLVRSLIYPVPDPRFPFLGVHFTRRIDGTVEVGPNAVLALGREHYQGEPIDWSELGSILKHRGFQKLAGRHWVSGTRELLNSRSRHLYARLARRLIPGLQAKHLVPGGVGIRAQALDMEGNLVDDFVIETAGRTVNVLNAPSPGATASIAIGRYVAREAESVIAG